MSKYLIHAYEGNQAQGGVLTFLLDDKVFRIPAREPFEVVADSNGRDLGHPDFYAFMLLQMYEDLYGLIEVPSTRDRMGVHLDYDRALELSEARLMTNRARRINLWAQEQLEGRVRANLPVLPPSGFVDESIKLLNVDVQAKFGFKVIGYDWRPDKTRPIDGVPVLINESAEELNFLRAENEEMKAKLAGIEAMLERLLNQAPTPAPPQPTDENEAKHTKASPPKAR